VMQSLPPPRLQEQVLHRVLATWWAPYNALMAADQSSGRYRIIRHIQRPAPDVLERLRGRPANHFTGPFTLGHELAMDPAIKPIRDDMYVFGPAVTVRPGPGDHLMSMYATMLAQPGDVVVVEGGGRTDVAIWGFGMSRSLKIRNLAGVVVDGMVLDRKGLLTIDAAVFARGANAGWGTRTLPGSINVPIVCGGRTVCPGDLIVGDADGVVVVPRERVPEAESLVTAYNDDLAKRAAQLREGTRAYFEIVGLQDVIDALHIPEFDHDPTGQPS